jgi:CheY-like chemotaxis protein
MANPKPTSLLIAERERDSRATLREIASSLFKNALIVEAADGAQAEFKLNNQVFDLIILSQKLPGRDGIQLLKGLQQQDPKKYPKAVILLTEGTPQEAWKGLFPALYFLEKPFEAETLKNLIQKCREDLKLLSVQPATS